MKLPFFRIFVFFVVLVFGLLNLSNTCQSQIIEKPKKVNPIKLEALTPKLDLSKPKEQKVLTGQISDTYHPDYLVIPKSGSSKAYEIGLQLYNDGDYRRALNAFKLAMIRGAKYGISDPRVKNAKAAIKSTESRLNMQAKLGYKTDSKDSRALTGVVQKVFKPSLAWLGGLKVDDRIIKANLQENIVKLTVVRNKKTYHLNLKFRKKAKKINLVAMEPKKKLSRSDIVEAGKIIHSELLQKNEKLLASYDCALLVDTSGSMSSPIIVRSGENILDSRWGWCRKNCVGFYNKSGRYFPQGLTLIPFNDKFAVATGAKSQEIDQVFTRLTPNGGTVMSAPLAYVLDDYFKRRKANPKVKPLAIAVLTDGEVSVNSIRDVLLDATSKMRHSREIKITFLSIGNGLFGSPTLKALDDDLVSVGAAYDIVDTRYFGEILKYGLLKVIVAALIENKVEGK